MTFLTLLVVFVLAAGVSSLLNWAIYRLNSERVRWISPWSKPGDQTEPRTWKDRIPIVGWFFLMRESEHHGSLFWLRPMMIELVFSIGMTWYYNVSVLGNPPWMFLPPMVPVLGESTYQLQIWYAWQFVLFALMIVATFIDFDDQIIPDSITFPGTILGLLLMLFLPSAQLPLTQFTAAGPVVATGMHLGSPGDLPEWIQTVWGLWACIGFVLAAGLALLYLDLVIPFYLKLRRRFGAQRAKQFLLADLMGRPRKNEGEFPIKPRRPDYFYQSIPLITLVFVGITVVTWMMQESYPANWESYVSSVFGMAFSAGIVWAIRIIGRYTLKKEAMGFGDVTLMGMIGAFVGWQAALLIFLIAPFASLVVVMLQYGFTLLFKGFDLEIAYGPYLCFAALLVVGFWPNVWLRFGATFTYPDLILQVLAVCLVLAGVLLWLMRLAKIQFGLEERDG